MLRASPAGGARSVVATTRKGSIPPTSGGDRLRLGLPGYLIPFAPLAFAPQRQEPARTLPSPLVFLRISTHFTAPPGIPGPSLALQSSSPCDPWAVKPATVPAHLLDRLRALYAQ